MYRDNSDSDHTEVSIHDDSPTEKIRRVISSSFVEAFLRGASASMFLFFEAFAIEASVVESDESIEDDDKGEASNTKDVSHGKEIPSSYMATI